MSESDDEDEDEELRKNTKLKVVHGSDEGGGEISLHAKRLKEITDRVEDASHEKDHDLAKEAHDAAAKAHHNKKKGHGRRASTVNTADTELMRKFSVIMTAGQQQQQLENMKKLNKMQKQKAPMATKWSQLRSGAFGPNYSLDEIKHFYTCFAYVDKDMSGEIDVDEWQEFLASMDQMMSATDSRRLFMHIDSNHNGAVSLDEIVKVVFNRASHEQHRIMVNVMEHSNNSKKMQQTKKLEFSRADLRALFNIYDEAGDKKLPVGKLAAAFIVLGLNQQTVGQIFDAAGITEGDYLDTEEFVDLFHNHLKKVVLEGGR